MSETTLFCDLGTRLSRDRSWIRDTSELEARVTARTIKLAIMGTVVYVAFLLLALLPSLGSENSAQMKVTLEPSLAMGALAVLMTSSTLLTTISVSVALRIRGNDDQEFARFVQPISIAALSTAIFAPPLSLASVFSSAPFRIDAPILVVSIVSTGLICLMSALTIELLELGPDLGQARAKEAAAATSTKRRLAAMTLVSHMSNDTRSQKKKVAGWHGAGCAIIGVAVSSIWAAIEFPVIKPDHFILGGLTGSTLAISLIATYSGQLQLRRGSPVDSLFIFLSATIWIVSVGLVGSSTGNLYIQLMTIGTLTAAVIAPVIFFSRWLANVGWLQAMSIRQAVARELLLDAKAADQRLGETSAKRTPGFLVRWYRTVTGAIERETTDG